MASTCVLTALYYTPSVKETTFLAYHHLAAKVHASTGKVLQAYEYTMDNQYGYNLAVPDVPLDWDLLEPYLSFFCVMHGDYEYMRGASDVHAVSFRGRALDGKDYPLPDISKIVFLDNTSSEHTTLMAQASEVLSTTYGSEKEVDMVKRMGAMESPFVLRC